MKFKVPALLIAASVAISACMPMAAPQAPTAQPTATQAPAAEMQKDIVDTAVAAGSFTTLATALGAANLVDTLKGEGPFTVFAPTDEAFAKLPAGTVEALLKDPKALGDILLYHVVPGKVMAADVVNLTSADTALGQPISIKVEDGKVFINDAQVTATDIVTSNGVIHVIDSVILPPAAPASEMQKDIVDTAVAAGSFTTLATALGAANLVDTLKGEGPFTVFAPTDEAFAKLPAGTVEALLKDPKALGDILLYHVVPGKVMAADVVNLTSADTALGQPISIKVEGGKVYINDAQVTTTDIVTSNGVIHVIDSVILPPAAPASEMQKDIVDTAVAAGSFTTLATALSAAGLIDTLKGEGPFTVFAPTDDAFAKLPAGTVEALLKDPKALGDILLYHVVPGKVMAADVVNLTSADTALGQPISIKVMGGKVYINDAEVITTDIVTSNGVIHVIDSVILPPAQ